MEKLRKFKPLIAVFNGKCESSEQNRGGLEPPPPGLTASWVCPAGIYEMFCRELFGKKPQKLEFGLQPHKIPECDVVSPGPV